VRHVSDQTTERVGYTHIGGQAVLEGIMMRGKDSWALAVRLADGSIHTEDHDLVSAAQARSWLGAPIMRGMAALVETLQLAMKAFSRSAQLAGETEEEQLSSREVLVTMILGIGMAILLFIVAPALLTNFAVGPATERPFVWNAVDGALRVTAFFIYIWAIGRIPDIQRVFMYHGAEHKTIHAYEHGLPLEPAIIQRYSTAHVRCGTSFLLMVMIIALIVFSFVPVRALAGLFGVDSRVGITLIAVSLRIVLLPLIAGLAYEVIKWAGRNPDNALVRVLLWPGLQLQRMTTREPTDDMVEVAVAAVIPIVQREGAIDGSPYADLRSPGSHSDAPEADAGSLSDEPVEQPGAAFT
jgi:uncharacterized protein YqhQ